MDTIGNRINFCRKFLKKSQEEFAKLCGVESRVTVSNWENDNRIPDVNTLITISRISSVTLDWLLAGNGSPPTKKEYRKNESNRTELKEPSETYDFTEDEIQLIQDIRLTGSKEKLIEIVELKKKTQKVIYDFINVNNNLPDDEKKIKED
ncbi:MAG: helix-turn-helix domain-containing protein [Rhodothermaceae bacterium]